MGDHLPISGLAYLLEELAEPDMSLKPYGYDDGRLCTISHAHMLAGLVRFGTGNQHGLMSLPLNWSKRNDSPEDLEKLRCMINVRLYEVKSSRRLISVHQEGQRYLLQIGHLN